MSKLSSLVIGFIMSRQPLLERPSPPRESYTDYLTRRMRQGGWFAKPRDFLLVMNFSESDLVCHLLNCGKIRADKFGWVPANSKFLLNGLRMSEDHQERVIDRLCRVGFLEMKGLPHARLLRVNTQAIEDAIERVCES